MIPNSLIPWIDFSNVTFIQFNNSWINTSNIIGENSKLRLLLYKYYMSSKRWSLYSKN
jgi:hypothetical protein